MRTDELVQVFGHGDDSGARMGHCDEEVPHLRQILDPILSWGQDKWTDPGVQCAVCRLAGLLPPQTILPSGKASATSESGTQTKWAVHPQ